MVELIARDYLDPNGRIDKSGEMLARRAIETLRSGEAVRIQLQGLPGMSSSYFNIFLLMIRDELGPEALERIRMDFISPLQKQIFDRSFDAVVQTSTP
jgi:hypothetical protein